MALDNSVSVFAKNARGNDETVATAIDRDFVSKFANEFMRLCNGNKQY